MADFFVNYNLKKFSDNFSYPKKILFFFEGKFWGTSLKFFFQKTLFLIEEAFL